MEELVDRLSILPEELQVPILAELPFWKLQLVCRITREGTRVRKFKANICSDYEVVKGSLQSSGFALPEDFKTWVEVTKPPEMGLFEFIDLYFFQIAAQVKEFQTTLELIFERSKLLWSTYINHFARPLLPKAKLYISPLVHHIDEVLDEHLSYLLDHRAINQQIYYFGKRHPNQDYENSSPITFYIDLKPEVTVSFGKTKLSNFIEKIGSHAQSNLNNSPFAMPFGSNDYTGELFYSQEKIELLRPKIEYTIEQATQQDLQLILILAEEGDIIRYHDEDGERILLVYLDAEGELSIESIRGNYLPISAIPFLVSKNIDTLNKLRSFEAYKSFEGFVTPEGRQVHLARDSEQFRPIVIEGFTFKAYTKQRENVKPLNTGVPRGKPLTRVKK